MPPLIPSTSPVAIAAARIFTAYASNHRLTLADAAELCEAIVATLTGLTEEVAPPADMLPAVARRRPSWTSALHPAPEPADAGGAAAHSLPELEPEPALERDAPAEAPAPVRTQPPERRAELRDESRAFSLVGSQAGPRAESLPPELSAPGQSESPPPRRKRPSRPRSKRGLNGASAAVSPGAPRGATHPRAE